jgi:hypothetical protein
LGTGTGWSGGEAMMEWTRRFLQPRPRESLVSAPIRRDLQDAAN